MRPTRRPPPPSSRRATPPPRSRLTVTPAPRAPFARATRLGQALSAGREALADIERQLDALLAVVRAPDGRPDADAADRLHRATRKARAAVARLGER